MTVSVTLHCECEQIPVCGISNYDIRFREPRDDLIGKRGWVEMVVGGKLAAIVTIEIMARGLEYEDQTSYETKRLGLINFVKMGHANGKLQQGDSGRQSDA